jgi:kynurenine formamidase
VRRRRARLARPVIDLAPLLAAERLVDLTQPLSPATVLWPGSSPLTTETIVDYDAHGSYARDVHLPEHAGTHADAPAHFARDGLRVDELPLGDLVRPAVRLDVRELVGDDPRFTLSAQAITEIERRQGTIPAGSAVLVHTGWDRHLADAGRYRGPGQTLAFPGIAVDAAELLVDRGVAGIGIDTLGIDPGHAHDFPAHRVTLGAGLWQLEGLVGLERIPARGAWLVAAVIPVVAGSGAWARAFAIVP